MTRLQENAIICSMGVNLEILMKWLTFQRNKFLKKS